MSAADIDLIWARRHEIESALRQILDDVALSAPEGEIPWAALEELYKAVSGLSETTRRILRAAIAEVGYEGAVEEIRRWLAADHPPSA